jgi:hypothetical protein
MNPFAWARPPLYAILFPWLLSKVCVDPLTGYGVDNIMREPRRRPGVAEGNQER